MKMNAAHIVVDQGFSSATTPRLNRQTGWCLFLAALVSAAWLGLGFLKEASVHLGPTPAREAQTLIAVLGVLQLATSQLLRDATLASGTRNSTARLTASGSLFAALGFVSDLRLIAIGALMNFVGYIVLITRLSTRRRAREIGLGLVMICFAMLLMAAMAIYGWQAKHFAIIDLGPDDGFTLRTLRLARVAAIVLPVLTFLYEGLADESEPCDRVVRTGRLMMLCGTVGMATILVGAGLIFVYLKVLLIIPSIAIFAGVLCGLCLARRHAAPLETWGWLLIALSMSAGLLMGLYAFAGPWVTLQFPGEYNDYARRLIRLVHVDAVVLGLVAIFISREIQALKNHWHRIGAPLLIAGSIVMLGIPVLLAVANLSTAILNIGPVLVITATIICVGSTAAQKARVSQGGKS
jgi:hypothetical protein